MRSHLIGRWSVGRLAGFVFIVAVVACSGSSASPTPLPAQTSPATTSTATAGIDLPSPPIDLPSPPIDLPSPPGADPGFPDEPPPVPIGTPPGAAPTPGSFFGRHADVDLESQLPAEIAGTPLTVFSVKAADLINPTNEQAFDGFIGRLGKSASDVTLAAAVDPSGAVVGSIYALRVAGADPDDLLGAMLDMEAQNADAPPTIAEAVIAGLPVTTITYEIDVTQIRRYVYVRGDTVFAVGGADERTATLFLEALP